MSSLERLRSSRVARTTLFVIASALLVVALVGVWNAFAEAAQEPPTVGYEHAGEFRWSAGVCPTVLYSEELPPEVVEPPEEPEPEEETLAVIEEEEEEPKLVFFQDIIDEFRMGFVYDISTDEPLQSARADVVVTIVGSAPDLWNKELANYYLDEHTLPVTIEFEVDADWLDDKIERIEKDIGLTSTDHEYNIVANVLVTGVDHNGMFVWDRFTHELLVTSKEKVLEMEGPLTISTPCDFDDTGCEHEGHFYYDVYLEYNDLYDELALRSDPLPVALSDEQEPEDECAEVTWLHGQEAYFPAVSREMAVEFSYVFDCADAIEEPTETVTMDLIVKQPGLWSRRLPLVAATEQEGAFKISAPIDIHMVQRLVDAIREELRTSGASYDMAVETHVTVRAETPEVPVRDTQVFTLTGHVEGGVLSFEPQEATGRPGTAVSARSVEENSVRPWLSPWLAVVLFAIVLLGLLLWNEVLLRRYRLTPMELEDKRIRKKYAALIVDLAVGTDSATGVPETCLQMDSIDELARIAEDLAKPIVRRIETSRQWFAVIDGNVRYEYVLEADSLRDSDSMRS